ncbi:Thiosulfate sulfurtransferase/rhodanese-like domain-containing protein 3 [Bagarius yarrelli]|uniref:Thiosulfate sulfurtransferase/rhodanese-like domain-containing protein 3 n=1 Tax=Bagarius yarrelli TaxID=175774 RepID=A0A556U6G7_BAGYA|nr:Thiosulfate sulfurtransferase/rhodanese-like domain-containing protein 3 [Bagarius yarrelli]
MADAAAGWSADDSWTEFSNSDWTQLRPTTPHAHRLRKREKLLGQTRSQAGPSGHSDKLSTNTNGKVSLHSNPLRSAQLNHLTLLYQKTPKLTDTALAPRPAPDHQTSGVNSLFLNIYSSRHAGVKTESWTQSFCTAKQPEGSVTYEQVKKLLVSGSAVVIDVREPWELREYGSMPGSINVPLGQVKTALQLKPEEFMEKYGGEMPSVGEHLVFSCLAGVRSQKALDEARTLGYSK